MATQSPPDAIQLLKADHREVEGLFEQFEKARGAQRKQKLVEQICLELTVHTMIEEEIFYPACKEAKVEEDDLDEAHVEHDGAKVLMAELMASGPDEDYYDAKVKVLKEQIEHHVKEEEVGPESIFGQFRKSDVDLKALGAQMMERKEFLTAQFKATGLPAPETRTFSGHELEQGEVVEEPLQPVPHKGDQPSR